METEGRNLIYILAGSLNSVALAEQTNKLLRDDIRVIDSPAKLVGIARGETLYILTDAYGRKDYEEIVKEATARGMVMKSMRCRV
jgi:homoserine dehydrogenase